MLSENGLIQVLRSKFRQIDMGVQSAKTGHKTYSRSKCRPENAYRWVAAYTVASKQGGYEF